LAVISGVATSSSLWVVFISVLIRSRASPRLTFGSDVRHAPSLDNGVDSITVASYDTGLGVEAITGVTGAYAGASGPLDLSRSEIEFTVQVHLS